MTQKVFDTDNAEDMALLWSILPDDVVRVVKDESHGWANNYCKFKRDDYSDKTAGTLFNINWHDKTEITRPIKEATEADIGKLCKFWNDKSEEFFGRLGHIGDKYFTMIAPVCEDIQFLHCRRLTKQEIEQLC